MGYLKDFGAGIGVGAAAFGAEFYIFVLAKVINAFSEATQTLPSNSMSESIFPLFSFSTLILGLMGLGESFFLGLLNSKAFTIGFLIGDGIMIFIFANALLEIAPSVLTGMIIALIIVLIGFFYKLFKDDSQNDQWTY